MYSVVLPPSPGTPPPLFYIVLYDWFMLVRESVWLWGVYKWVSHI